MDRRNIFKPGITAHAFEQTFIDKLAAGDHWQAMRFARQQDMAVLINDLMLGINNWLSGNLPVITQAPAWQKWRIHTDQITGVPMDFAIAKTGRPNLRCYPGKLAA